MSSVLVFGTEPTGVHLCGVFRNEATFFNHVDMLSYFSRGTKYHTSMLTKQQVKSILTGWAAGGVDDNLVELPYPYPNFSTFTWKHASMNTNPANHPKSDMKSTLTSQPFFMLRLSESTYDTVQKMLIQPKMVHFKPDITSYSAFLLNTPERRQVNVSGALELLSDPSSHPPSSPPNKRRKLERVMLTPPVHDQPLELKRSSSSISYVSLLSPASVKSITSNFNLENKLSDEETGLLTPPLTPSPSFKIEFTQNYVLTPLKMPVNFLHDVHDYSE